ncbi:MBOAT family O-acyltransferase [Flavivirga algicola]|uniref:MBOAT family protein n=1 Tax=Flavivirga algicola TaxID=2729136 RepID=A0ABX1S064_9FLAO|nr:MBOAT family protein [Flavivirga algicola]NMH88625.1 MBOAT family protein [Flavivirga algicola]
MLFNSIDFAIFLPIVFILYWFVFNKNLKLQNVFVVIASYFFYGCWDWRFLFLILFSTVIDYSVGFQLAKEAHKTKRKILLWISIVVNLGLLGVFKYYNFFIDNFTTMFSFFNMRIEASSLNIVLPVGISFYTFQTLSYTIDVYKRKMEPTKDFISFSAFVSFFPQLVAGPIEKASNLLPQFYKKRTFDYSKAVDGLRQILWGLIKKVVIADNCARYVNEIFLHSDYYSGSTLLLGALLFAFQIYGDFSGYSDIAIGTSRLFGFHLKKNFAFPYFSRDIAEFWRRWHISLSTWFKDYLYIPLGGSRGSVWSKIRNVFIIFIVSGFWHGANWTFIVWGVLNAIYFLPLLLTHENRVNTNVVAEGKSYPSVNEFLNILKTFGLTLLGWVFFRADNVQHALHYMARITSLSLFTVPKFLKMGGVYTTLMLIMIFILIEWKGREQQYAIAEFRFKQAKYMRWVFYLFLGFILFYYGDFNKTEFIYFAF